MLARDGGAGLRVHQAHVQALAEHDGMREGEDAGVETWR